MPLAIAGALVCAQPGNGLPGWGPGDLSIGIPVVPTQAD